MEVTAHYDGDASRAYFYTWFFLAVVVGANLLICFLLEMTDSTKTNHDPADAPAESETCMPRTPQSTRASQPARPLACPPTPLSPGGGDGGGGPQRERHGEGGGAAPSSSQSSEATGADGPPSLTRERTLTWGDATEWRPRGPFPEIQ